MSGIYLVAAEASGDELAAEFIDAVRAVRPDMAFFGVGGAAMAERGVPSLLDISDLSIVGLFDGVKIFKLLRRRVEETAEDVVAKSPDAVVLVDSWGFTSRVAEQMKAIGAPGIPIKLVGPQVWATRPGRVKRLADTVDHVLCIHAFETPFYEPYGLPTTVIGNPAVSRAQLGDGAGFRARNGVAADAKLVGLLLGSRGAELRRVAPTLEAAAVKLCEGHPDRKVLCVAAPSVADAVKERSRDWRFPFILSTAPDEKSDAFNAMDMALSCSGTVTTELALQNTPMIVAYKIGWFSWALARAFLMKSKYITLLNVAAGAEIAPEFVQTRMTIDLVSDAGEKLLSSQGAAQTQINAQNAALEAMGRGRRPAAEIAAETVLQLIA